ncbi:hypothetical protein [Streptomyces sp. MST-110588]|uniref:hypothetical protein n=1 Tax=Streptomyces sp. MST-110588 TaxID=2833628 RepID=UPI001F5CAB09|nr:hypothetical protein [Streptomyces sp. MST-110588]UNO40656.1 hypothetical protein KGS77_15075 [Streptomyces sp. MST-110588]
MDMSLVRAAIGPESDAVADGSGTYVWIDADVPGQPVLYIGKSDNLRRRTSDERVWTEQFRDARRRGHSVWYAAGCGLSPVLAAAQNAQVLTWPMEKARAVATETALIRLAAMTGGTPPAQGAGWGWGRGDCSDSSHPVQVLLNTWFDPGHAVSILVERATR